MLLCEHAELSAAALATRSCHPAACKDMSNEMLHLSAPRSLTHVQTSPASWDGRSGARRPLFCRLQQCSRGLATLAKGQLQPCGFWLLHKLPATGLRAVAGCDARPALSARRGSRHRQAREQGVKRGCTCLPASEHVHQRGLASTCTPPLRDAHKPFVAKHSKQHHVPSACSGCMGQGAELSLQTCKACRVKQQAGIVTHR